MCGARWCISPSKKNSFDYFPYFFVVLHGHKSEGRNEKKKKNFSIEKWKGPAILCFAGRLKAEWHSVYTHTHTHTYAHSISLVMLLPSPSLYKLRISCGRTKAKRHQIFFFFLFLYAASQQSFHNIISPLSLSRIYRLSTRALLCVCVCVYWFLLSFRPQEGFSL